MKPTPTIQSHLQNLFQSIRQAVTTGNPEEWGQPGRNAKGDSVKWFDLAADQAACTYLAKRFPYPVRLLSEEGPPREFGRGETEFTMILDPVDGSDNFARRISPSGTAIALIPAGLPVSIGTVQFGLVGNLFSGRSWLAERGKGSFFDGQPLKAPANLRLEDMLLSFDTNRVTIDPGLAYLAGQAHGVRSFSAAAVVLAMVADGTVGAHLDLTGNLTPENFLASSLIISEAGGLVTDCQGQPLPDIGSLTEGYRLVAATTPELHTILVKKLSVKG